MIATNTTLSREGVENLPHGEESGGLSGAPVRDKSTGVIRQLAAELQGALPIIGVGGILHGSDAAEKIHVGAGIGADIQRADLSRSGADSRKLRGNPRYLSPPY